MDTQRTDQEALLAIARVLQSSGGLDEWNLSFQSPTLRDIYHLAAAQLSDDICRAHALPTYAAVAEAEARAARTGRPEANLPAPPLPEPWTKSTGEPL